MELALEFIERLQGVLDRGGLAMPFILLLSVVMWALILERYWFFWFSYPAQLARVQEAWARRGEHRSRAARRIRAQLSAGLAATARRHLPLIRTMIQVLPLLGLLGTVTGMIQTFEVITVYGGSNRRGIAGGISEALLCTMAGLITALSGLYFSVNLEQRVRRAAARAATLMYEK